MNIMDFLCKSFSMVDIKEVCEENNRRFGQSLGPCLDWFTKWFNRSCVYLFVGLFQVEPAAVLGVVHSFLCKRE